MVTLEEVKLFVAELNGQTRKQQEPKQESEIQKRGKQEMDKLTDFLNKLEKDMMNQ